MKHWIVLTQSNTGVGTELTVATKAKYVDIITDLGYSRELSCSKVHDNGEVTEFTLVVQETVTEILAKINTAFER